MWLNYLPTVEDLRDYQFNSLKKAEKKQLDVMGHFMDALDLMSCEDEEGYLIFKGYAFIDVINI